jgi:hypothetical protein
MHLTAGVSFYSPDIARAIGRQDSRVPRGARIPLDALSLVRNGQAMLSANMLVWRPPQAPPRPLTPGPTAKVQPDAPPRDDIAELRQAMKVFVDAGDSWSVAEDRILSSARGCDLFARAQKQYALSDRRPFRRGVDGFRAHLQQGASP